jgi:hypothetical protein
MKLKKIICPKCGNDGTSKPIEWFENIPSYRKVHGIVNGILFINIESKDFYEGATGSTLMCGECFFDWGVPCEMRTDFVDHLEYEGIRESASERGGK